MWTIQRKYGTGFEVVIYIRETDGLSSLRSTWYDFIDFLL